MNTILQKSVSSSKIFSIHSFRFLCPRMKCSTLKNIDNNHTEQLNTVSFNDTKSNTLPKSHWQPIHHVNNEEELVKIEPFNSKDHKILQKDYPEYLPPALLGLGNRCKHGYAQTLVFSTLYYDNNIKNEQTIISKDKLKKVTKSSSHIGQSVYKGENVRVRIHTGGIWLRCPLLVNMMDEWEKSGCLEIYSAKVLNDKSLKDKTEHFHKNIVPRIRRSLIPKEWQKKIDNEPNLNHIKQLLDVGLIGITRPEHVKCLHAHLGDYLGRQHKQITNKNKENTQDFTNPIGKMVYEHLVDENFPVHGTDECWKLCSNQECSHKKTNT